MTHLPVGSSHLGADPLLATLRWIGGPDGHLVLIDQTKLPHQVVLRACHDVDALVDAICSLAVRGAPALGIAAAYGICLGIAPLRTRSDEAFFTRLDEVAQTLASSRPTAVNLSWALDRMKRVARAHRGREGPRAVADLLLGEARAIHDEDRRMCHAIGHHGARLLAGARGVLTHCNAGGLATSEYGTALAVIFAAHEAGAALTVYVDETRPLFQGARLTAWELLQRGIDATVICDSAAAQVMRDARVQAVVTGADRIAANGDTANKIGTYGLAVLAAAHEIPFFVAAPSSTFDLAHCDASRFPIEERSADEITWAGSTRIAPEGVSAYNPAFDVTPARLIRAIVCEKGVIEPVTHDAIASMLQS